jgi:hypothetical protein
MRCSKCKGPRRRAQGCGHCVASRWSESGGTNALVFERGRWHEHPCIWSKGGGKNPLAFGAKEVTRTPSRWSEGGDWEGASLSRHGEGPPHVWDEGRVGAGHVAVLERR